MAAGAPAAYHLKYFDLPGRAEPIRLLLAASGLAWSEERLSFAEWGARKGPGTESGEFPFGQMPVLTLADGKVLAQSKAIARFVAQEGNLYYTNNRTAADADAIVEALADIAAPYGPILFSDRTQEEKVAALAELVAKLPAQLAPVKKLFKGAFFQDAPSFVDIYMTGVIRTLEGFTSSKIGPTLEGFSDMYAAVNALPAIRAHDAK